MPQVMYRVVTYGEGKPVTGPLTMSEALRQAEAFVGSSEIIEPVSLREDPHNDGTTHYVGVRVRELSIDDPASCTWLYKVQRIDPSSSSTTE